MKTYEDMQEAIADQLGRCRGAGATDHESAMFMVEIFRKAGWLSPVDRTVRFCPGCGHAGLRDDEYECPGCGYECHDSPFPSVDEIVVGEHEGTAYNDVSLGAVWRAMTGC